MFIIHVSAIIKNRMGNLSYFSSKEFPIGSIITIPLRKKEVMAVVLQVENAQNLKSVLRTNLYETKKIKKQNQKTIFLNEFSSAANITANYFATSAGRIIQSYTPSVILDNSEIKQFKNIANASRKSSFKKSAMQLPKHERIEKYKTLIRTKFANKESVFILCSTFTELKYIEESVKNGIEQYTFSINSYQSKKIKRQLWKDAIASIHPVLIIATPTFLSIPRSDIGLFIIENELSSYYKQIIRPYIDARILTENIAREMQSELLYAGTLLRLKTQEQINSGFIISKENDIHNIRHNAEVKIIDVTEGRIEAKETKKKFPVITDQSLEKLKQTSHLGKLSFIFAARKGLAPQTICNDCGKTVLCNECNSIMVLHENKSKRNLLCHRCGHSRNANERCSKCDSWNLVPLGIGITRIEKYLEKHLPNIPIYILSNDTAKTPKQMQKIILDFYSTDGAILIGTEMALAHLNSKISCSIVSSIDSILSIADFHIEEKLFYTIAKISEFTKEFLYIETSSGENTVLKFIKSGSIYEYIKYELNMRKKFLYPPFTIIVKVTCAGTKDTVIVNTRKFIELIKKYNPRVFKGFIKKGRIFELHTLIRIPTKNWPDENLVEILKGLPMQFSVDINPERLI